MIKSLLLLAVVAFAGSAEAQDFGRGGFGGRESTEMITCMSKDFRPASCQASGEIRNIRLVVQKSKSACIEGSTYGVDGDSVWVTNGCHAQFRVTVRQQGGGHSGQAQLRCESAGYNYASCRLGRPIYDIYVISQISKTPCIGGSNFGITGDRRGVWVDRGCAAIFGIELY